MILNEDLVCLKRILKLSSLNMNNPYQVMDPIFSSPYTHERVCVDQACLFVQHNTGEYYNTHLMFSIIPQKNVQISVSHSIV